MPTKASSATFCSPAKEFPDPIQCRSVRFFSFLVKRSQCGIARRRKLQSYAKHRKNSSAKRPPTKSRHPTDFNTALIICAAARRLRGNEMTIGNHGLRGLHGLHG